MRCTDRDKARAMRLRERKRQRIKAILMLILIICLAIFAGLMIYKIFFADHELAITNPYNIGDSRYGVMSETAEEARAESFAANLCVTAGDVSAQGVSLQNAYAGAMLDLNDDTVLYATNVHEKLYPASLTKIMTALVALKYGNLDDEITIDEIALDIDAQSSVCYLQLGDVYTLKQLIYGLLIASGNDAGNAIANHVGGSIENFVSMMNEEAQKLGATNTHFTNAHGLQDEEHYTTVYDVYLMFNEAMKYDVFMDAINKESYVATYTDAAGDQYERTWSATNYYFQGLTTAPEGVNVYGGKTGTTDEAGACLSLLSKDDYGNTFLGIIMKADTKDDLYDDMNELLALELKK